MVDTISKKVIGERRNDETCVLEEKRFPFSRVTMALRLCYLAGCLPEGEMREKAIELAFRYICGHLDDIERAKWRNEFVSAMGLSVGLYQKGLRSNYYILFQEHLPEIDEHDDSQHKSPESSPNQDVDQKMTGDLPETTLGIRKWGIDLKFPSLQNKPGAFFQVDFSCPSCTSETLSVNISYHE